MAAGLQWAFCCGAWTPLTWSAHSLFPRLSHTFSTYLSCHFSPSAAFQFIFKGYKNTQKISSATSIRDLPAFSPLLWWPGVASPLRSQGAQQQARLQGPLPLRPLSSCPHRVIAGGAQTCFCVLQPKRPFSRPRVPLRPPLDNGPGLL